MSKLFRIIQRTFSTTTPGLNVGKGRAAFLRAQGQPLTIEPVNTESNSLSPSQVIAMILTSLYSTLLDNLIFIFRLKFKFNIVV